MKKRAELEVQQDMSRRNKAKEIMELIFAEDLDLTEYSDTLLISLTASKELSILLLKLLE